MIREYIATAMNHAEYEILADDNSYYGEISFCPGVYTNRDNLEECRNELEEILEERIPFRVHRQLPINTLYKALCPDNPTIRKVPGSISEPLHCLEINPLHSFFPVLPNTTLAVDKLAVIGQPFLCPFYPLHAWRLRFAHPLTREKMTFDSPLPADMTAVLESLRTGCGGESFI